MNAGCRRTLEHYLHKAENEADEAIDKKHSAQFQYHKEMLERFTEELSELKEKPLNNFKKTEIVNKTGAIKKLRDKVVEYL